MDFFFVLRVKPDTEQISHHYTLKRGGKNVLHYLSKILHVTVSSSNDREGKRKDDTQREPPGLPLHPGLFHLFSLPHTAEAPGRDSAFDCIDPMTPL